VFPWIIAAGLVYMLWAKDASPAPTPDPKPVVVTLEKATAGVLPLIRTENSRIFAKAADMVRRKEIQDSSQLYDYVNAATKAAREAASKPFDVAFEATLPRDSEGSFRNMEEQAAKVLERVAKSW
jgi:hypothetical protein